MFSSADIISHVSFQSTEETVHNLDQKENVDYKKVVKELKKESKRIDEALEVLTKARNEAEGKVKKMREIVDQKKKEAKSLSSWPLQLADDVKKWEKLWEGDFGKKVLRHQSHQLAENATVVSDMNCNVQYCRKMIYFKRISQQNLTEESRRLRKNSQSELNRVQREINWLKDQVAEWKLKVVQNEVVVEKLKIELNSTNMEVVEKRTQVDEVKADLEELKRKRHLEQIHRRGRRIMNEI
ncbi:unnamed protein product [Bursaphelenchus xylophilus]|uniref:(pine wood nematode) hypothetical protein n=1 Tax=Bursaphelenchus xylophilus TaxID=6326 RepID=A0A1I7RPI8_BURXY|nr:unnamed protein product [Bursaphelenchus xylophilus]CAG9096094.1 unnamed protein product [Bursaphelenchus xylophilus]